MLELGSSEDFHSLRKCRGAQDSGQQDCVYDLFPHRILPSETASLSNYFDYLQPDPEPSLSCSSCRGHCQELQMRRQQGGNCDCVESRSDNVGGVKQFFEHTTTCTPLLVIP